VNPLSKQDINGGDKRNKHTHSQHTASVSEPVPALEIWRPMRP